MQTRNDWLVINWQVQDLREAWKRQDRRRVRLLIFAVVVLCVLVALTVAPVLSAPPDPECRPPTAVTLQRVEGKEAWWLLIIVMAVAAISIMVIGDLLRSRKYKARQQELDEQCALWDMKLRELEQ